MTRVVLVRSLALVGLLLCSRMALAAPEGANEEKDWRFGTLDTQSVIPESEPNNTCPGQSMACGDVISPASITAGDLDWYQFAANAGDKLTIGTDVVVPGNTCDTVVELYRDDCTSLLTSNDDGGPGTYSLISAFVAPYTGVYNVKVRGYSGSTTGPYSMFVICCSATPPADDTCAGASTLACGTGTLAGHTACYINDYDPGVPGPSCTGFSAAGLDLVYVLDVAAGDVVDLVYTSSADGSFYIVTDCANETGSCVIGADETLSGEPEVINWVAPAAGIYYLILDSYGTGTSGAWTLDYSITCPVLEGACCFTDGTCVITTRTGCAEGGGEYQGDGTVCDPNPCEPTPTIDSSWGEVKTIYR